MAYLELLSEAIVAFLTARRVRGCLCLSIANEEKEGRRHGELSRIQMCIKLAELSKNYSLQVDQTSRMSFYFSTRCS
jgi:hypothetical protein